MNASFGEEQTHSYGEEVKNDISPQNILPINHDFSQTVDTHIVDSVEVRSILAYAEMQEELKVRDGKTISINTV